MPNNAPGLSAEWAEFKDKGLRPYAHTITQFLSIALGVAIPESARLMEESGLAKYQGFRIALSTDAAYTDLDHATPIFPDYETVEPKEWGIEYQLVDFKPPGLVTFIAGYGPQSNQLWVSNVRKVLTAMLIYNIDAYKHNQRIKADKS